ncbi:hypothetical protein FKP32DRAFT_1526624, partial [Trametes sanguinea]
ALPLDFEGRVDGVTMEKNGWIEFVVKNRIPDSNLKCAFITCRTLPDFPASASIADLLYDRLKILHQAQR